MPDPDHHVPGSSEVPSAGQTASNDPVVNVNSSSAPAPRWTPLDISDHELLQPIASGSYGEVWLARNALGTRRAVKIVRRGCFERTEDFEREFKGLQNFEPLSRSHEGFVDILQIGRQANCFYYVMELADDASESQLGPSSVDEKPVPGLQAYTPRTLRCDLRARRALPVEEVVRLGLGLTAALGRLHGEGFVHRDVKPSNILFIGGVAKLADVGLVAAMGDAHSLVGTAGYIAPEGPGSPRADLYSLGKVLYEATFGKDRQDFPQLPSDLASWPDHTCLLELNEIIIRACARDVDRRYPSAEEMGSDLERLQRGQSVREHHLRHRRWQAVRRVAALGAATLVLAAGLFLLWQKIDRRAPSIGLSVEEAGTKSGKAIEAYQLGRSALRRGTKDGFRHGLMQFTLATEADRSFVAAHARLFELYLMSEDHGFDHIDGKTEELKKLAAKLVKMDPGGPETHAASAITGFLIDWKWSEAESEFKQALEDKNCRMALTYYGYFLTRLRREREARDVLERARTLDPTSPLIAKLLGHCAYLGRDYESALLLYSKASSAELEPSYPSGNYWAGRAQLAMTNYPQALTEFEQFEFKNSPRTSDESHNQKLREAWEKHGPRGYWTERIALADADSIGQAVQPSYLYAECYARLNQRTQALEWLEKALVQHDSMENLLVDEFWDDFRQEPRFRAVLRTVGLDRYAR